MRRTIQVKYLAIIFVLTLSTTAQAETPVVEWVRQSGTSCDDIGVSVSIDGSGNAYINGYTSGSLDGNTNAGNVDIFLTKYDTDGNKLWTKQLGSPKDDYGFDVSVDDSGNSYVTGYTSDSLDGNTSMGLDDIFLTKYNTDGTKLWTKQLGSTRDDYGYGVSLDGNGNVYVTGDVGGSLDGNTSAGYYDMFLTKFNTDGTKLWTQQLGTDSYDRGYGVSVDSSGNAYVAGYTGGRLDGNTSAGEADMFLTKYNTDGNKLWTKQLGSSGYDRGLGVSVDSSGNAYVTGSALGSLDGNPYAGNRDMFLTKYDTDGTKLWTEQLGSASDDRGIEVSVDSSGNAYVAGRTGGSLDGNVSAGGIDILLTKYDTNGNKLWTEQMGSTSDDYGYGVSVDGNDNVYISGLTKGSLDGNPNAGGADIFLIKFSSVPEPSTIAMLAGIAFMALLLHRKRKHA